MAGVPSDITFTAENNATAQAAALIMAARNPTDPNAEVLSHDPPPDWTCWTQRGRDGAAASNLFRGLTGPAAMDGFVLKGLTQDPNKPPVDDSLGHRRTLLNPQILTMGSGSVPGGAGAVAAEAQLMVVDPSPQRHPTRDRFVAWPPRGFVPYQLVNAEWSFSLLDADFAAATVSMRRNGTVIPVDIRSRSNFAGPGIVWGADSLTGDTRWPKPAADDPIVVTIGNVVVNGVAETFTYTTTVFDPALADPDRTPLVITGPDAPAVNVTSNYAANAIPNATGYQWRSTKFVPLNLVDGAENGVVNFDVAAGDRSPIDTTGPATGASAFRLTKNGGRFFDPTTLTLNRIVQARPDTQLAFKSRLSFMQNLAAHVDVSTDGGATWTAVFSQVGATRRDATYVDKTVPLAAFAGQQMRVRFSMEYLGGTVFDHAWFIDDIALQNADEAFPAVLGEVTPTPTFAFTPTEEATYDLAVHAQSFGSGFGDWSAAKRVVAITPAVAPVFTTQPIGQTVTNGATVTFAAAASGTALEFAWARDGVDLVDGPGVQGSRTATLTLVNVTAAQAGSYTVRVSNRAGTITSAPAILVVTVPAGLAEALDGPGLVWTTGGNSTWSSQTAVTHDGVDAAQSGPMVDLQSTFATTTVTGPATLRFWWKVDSEANFDFLAVELDGVLQTRISGAVDWQAATVVVPGGDHTVSWTYSKDLSVSTGQDRGWIDQVEVGAGVAPLTLGDALDTAAPLLAGGDAQWAAQTTTNHDGIDAVRSGQIADNQSSSLSADGHRAGHGVVLVEGGVGGQLRLPERHARRPVAVPGISGNVDWELKSIPVPAGTHVIRWTYSKDVSVSTGRDAACGGPTGHRLIIGAAPIRCEPPDRGDRRAKLMPRVAARAETTGSGCPIRARSSDSSGLVSRPSRSSAQPADATSASSAPARRKPSPNLVCEIRYTDGNTAAVVKSWASSIPMLKANNVTTDVAPSIPSSVRMPAKARPWTRPKPTAIISSPRRASGRMAWTAETAIDAAMSTSTGRLGTTTHPSAEAISVRE